jgi:hypothetical protein
MVVVNEIVLLAPLILAKQRSGISGMPANHQIERSQFRFKPSFADSSVDQIILFVRVPFVFDFHNHNDDNHNIASKARNYRLLVSFGCQQFLCEILRNVV